MSELSFDSASTCSSDSCPFIEEPYFGENFSDDSLDDTCSDDIFPLSYSEVGWNSSDDNSNEIFDMSVQIVVSDDDVGVKEPKRKAPDTSRGKDKKSSIFIPDGDYGDEVIFVNPEHYSPRKKMKQEEEKRTAVIDNSSVGTDSDIAVTFAKKGIDFPHAREHCRIKKFVQIPSTTTKNTSNEEFCEKCYCYVCDDLSSKCESWKTGEKPHCNAYAKHAFWENERRLHKRNTRMKKFRFVPILTLLAPQKINQDMTKAAISCNKYVDEIQEASYSSYDMMTRKTCGCYCHDGFLDHIACPYCEWQHMLTQYSGDNGSHGRAMDKVRMTVSNSITLVESSFIRKQPNSAIVILDTITSLLLGVDINSPHSKYIYERDSSRIVSLWIEAALDKGLDKDLLSKAKERLSKSVKDNQSHLFLPEAEKIHRILSELRPYDDPLVVKSLSKRHKGGSGLKEPYEVAKLRLQYLKSNNKISEAINYILGAETVEPNNLKTHRLCDYSDQRNDLVDLLITKERMQEALAVCATHMSDKLPTDLGKIGKTSTGKSFNMHWTPIKSMSLKTFKILFNGLVKPTTSGLSEEGLKKAMTITLPGIYSNAYLSSLEFLEFLLDKIGAQNKNYKYPSEAVRKDVQQSASTFLDTKVKKGYNQFLPEDIKAPRNVPLTVYVIEILVQVVSTRYSVLKCLQSLVKKGLYWACQTLIFSSRVQATIQPSEVSYFSKTILPHCSLIPLDHFKIWFTNIHAIAYFQVLFNLVSDMFNAGSKTKGPEGVTLKKNAMLLSQTLMESILINSYGRDRSVIEKHFKTVQEKFPSEAAKKLGIPVSTWGPLEMEFIFKPNFKVLEAIRNSMGSQNKVEFMKKREILLQFVKKNSRFLQEAVIEIFIQLEMYKDLLECLSGMTAGYNGYESSFSKINTSLEEAKRMGDKTKTMALAEALKDYVANALVQASFSYSFRQYTKPIPRQVSECVKLIHSISKDLFMSIIHRAIDEVTQKYLMNTVIQQKRIELGKWLLEIKAIFTSVKENSEWSVVFAGILQGPLKRKHQIIMCLQWNTDLS